LIYFHCFNVSYYHWVLGTISPAQPKLNDAAGVSQAPAPVLTFFVLNHHHHHCPVLPFLIFKTFVFLDFCSKSLRRSVTSTWQKREIEIHCKVQTSC